MFVNHFVSACANKVLIVRAKIQLLSGCLFAPDYGEEDLKTQESLKNL